MAAKIRQFFVTRNEVLALLGSALEQRQGVLLEAGRSGLSPVSSEDLRKRPADEPIQIFAAESEPPPEAMRGTSPQPGRWGWVQIDLPVENGRTLLLGTIAAKSEWVDGETGLVSRNRSTSTLFNRLAKEMLGGLRTGMRARNVKSGAEDVVKGVQFSSGAEEWVREGGLLRQEGVDNIEYLISHR
jgi:hypothetical protein